MAHTTTYRLWFASHHSPSLTLTLWKRQTASSKLITILWSIFKNKLLKMCCQLLLVTHLSLSMTVRTAWLVQDLFTIWRLQHVSTAPSKNSTTLPLKNVLPSPITTLTWPTITGLWMTLLESIESSIWPRPGRNSMAQLPVLNLKNSLTQILLIANHAPMIHTLTTILIPAILAALSCQLTPIHTSVLLKWLMEHSKLV